MGTLSDGKEHVIIPHLLAGGGYLGLIFFLYLVDSFEGRWAAQEEYIWMVTLFERTSHHYNLVLA